MAHLKTMKYFASLEDQEVKDLMYGEQLELCRRLTSVPTEFRDESISSDWTPEED